MRSMILAGLVLLGATGGARGDFAIRTVYVVPNMVTGEYDWRLRFNQPPEVVPSGDSWRFDIDYDELPDPLQFDSEIAMFGGAASPEMTVREIVDGFFTPDILGMVPFSVDGVFVMFSTPFDLIGDPDLRFTFRIYAGTDGGTTNFGRGEVTPAPGAVVLAMLGLPMLRWARRCTT